MRKTPARFVLAMAATLVLVLSCYGLARAYLAYEAARAGRMLKELAVVKIGDSEGQVLPMLRRYGSCRGEMEPYKKRDKTDYECLVEIGPSGIYYNLDYANTSMFYRSTRAISEQPQPQALKSNRSPQVECVWTRRIQRQTGEGRIRLGNGRRQP